MRATTHLILMVFVMPLISACGSLEPTLQPEAEPTVAQPSGIETLAAGWHTIEPGGDTICSDGSPYRFFVRAGDPEKLLFYLQGGGGCADRERCDLSMQPSYKPTVPPSEKPRNTGIFNFNNPDNPFLEHSIVMAPYCTGDVHIGGADVTYPGVEEGQEPLVIHHQGRANVGAVLEWTYENVSAPERIFVTGSSAGSIPSPLYTAILANQYPEARIAQLGDGSGGYRGMAETRLNRDVWGTFSYLNNEPGFADEKVEEFNYERLYIAAAKANPKIQFAQYDAAEDDVQKRFLSFQGLDIDSLLPGLEANHADIRAEVPNFNTYIAGGPSHTILSRPEFYTFAADGIAIRDWVADLADFKAVEDVRCTDCNAEELVGGPLPAPMQAMWNAWEDPQRQYVEPFQIFDNLYYVGINWVAAYLLVTDDGLVLIDSLYGKWIPVLLRNIQGLGFNPADIKYVINTHGHFDHAGGSAIFQHMGARIVMAEEDWLIAETKPDTAHFYSPIPARDIVANDGDTIVLGDTYIKLYKTPGHTEGVLSIGFDVKDGDHTHAALTLGGVGLNFSGVERTESYLESYRRIQGMQDAVQVGLANHAEMMDVFQRRALLANRQDGDGHPFVDPEYFAERISTFIANAENKLAAEKAGTAADPLEELTKAISE